MSLSEIVSVTQLVEDSPSFSPQKREPSPGKEIREGLKIQGPELVIPRSPNAPEQHFFSTDSGKWRVSIQEELFMYREKQRTELGNGVTRIAPALPELTTTPPNISQPYEINHAIVEFFWEENIEKLVGLFSPFSSENQPFQYASEVDLDKMVGLGYGKIDALIALPDFTYYIIDHYKLPKGGDNHSHRKNQQVKKHAEGLTKLLKSEYGDSVDPTIVPLLGRYELAEDGERKENGIRLQVATHIARDVFPYLFAPKPKLTATAAD